MISKKISLLAIGYNYLEINKIQDELTNEFSKINFDFAISIRDSLYRLNVSEYEIILVDLTSSEMDHIVVLQEIYQKSKGTTTIVTVNSDEITYITEGFGVRSHFYVVKNINYIETTADCIRSIIYNQTKNKVNNIKLTPQNRPIFQQLTNTCHDQMLIIGLDYRIKMANEKLLEKYNCSTDDIIGKRCYELLYKFNEPCFEKNISCPLQNIIKTNEPSKVTHTHHGINNNQVVRTHISALPLVNEFGSFEDIMVARKEEMVSLAAPFDKTLLEELVNGLSEGLFFCDADNKIVLLNHAAENLLNVDKQHLVGKSIIELPLGDGLHWLDNILQDRESKNRLTKLEKIKVEQRWLMLRFVPLFENSQQYIGGFLYLTEKPQEPVMTNYDHDFISVSKLFSSKIVAEG